MRLSTVLPAASRDDGIGATTLSAQPDASSTRHQVSARMASQDSKVTQALSRRALFIKRLPKEVRDKAWYLIGHQIEIVVNRTMARWPNPELLGLFPRVAESNANSITFEDAGVSLDRVPFELESAMSVCDLLEIGRALAWALERFALRGFLVCDARGANVCVALNGTRLDPSRIQLIDHAWTVAPGHKRLVPLLPSNRHLPPELKLALQHDHALWEQSTGMSVKQASQLPPRKLHLLWSKTEMASARCNHLGIASVPMAVYQFGYIMQEFVAELREGRKLQPVSANPVASDVMKHFECLVSACVHADPKARPSLMVVMAEQVQMRRHLRSVEASMANGRVSAVAASIRRSESNDIPRAHSMLPEPGIERAWRSTSSRVVRSGTRVAHTELPAQKVISQPTRSVTAAPNAGAPGSAESKRLSNIPGAEFDSPQTGSWKAPLLVATVIGVLLMLALAYL